MLAWMGAEVIKLEKVKGGDPTRNEMNDVDGSYSLYFLQLNANKKSITLDMKDPEGKKILTDLLKDADVFVENIDPGDVEKLGFGWDEVHKINPRLIMASLKDFNRGSRFEHVKAFEPVAQCAGGAVDDRLVGRRQERPDPVRRGARRFEHWHAPAHRHSDRTAAA